ncbi:MULTISPECIES: DNA primase regulatory subunit PriL [Archaeoglobus]|jgi:DNA primase large subunit|uniref:DNA primase large subunit PriL n=2 Tax=Archaeoglobus fulgidus TaxID=2234 RepID=PRIL_ARCFU|nr:MULTISPECIES: DNA primase regulatory subunit PriL [Archaeoglobus]O29911.1 RecName: Full=DNA primase large subunit PriL [Archaeoglobus fulgidus DSM 4304]AAB90898.1 conserved hypothetical protein [Archaeoglobus fulgidus DSM 4304]AIG97157.1 Eukaryotic-type DNA primase, large subunit [Archaeoglobus fulgidus DSM 8774]MDI3498543.1 primase large subunit [Archaeoglobus sp.]
MKYLPLYPILARYPFLRIASRVFSFNIEDELRKFLDTVEAAKRIVDKAIDGRVEYDRFTDESEFFCLGCEENCYDCQKRGTLEGCDLCMGCFENCSLYYPREAVERFYTNAKLSLLTYIASRMIVSAMEDWVRMRYAVNEASYYSRLLREDVEESGKEPIVRLVAIDLGAKLKGWKMHVSTFVRVSARIKDDKWRLVNRKLRNGWVETTKAEVLRGLEELLRMKLFEKVPVSEAVSEAVRELSRKAKRESEKFAMDLGEVDLNCLPPCMREILSELQRGMNIPHTARFAITSFLLNIGMTVDEIIALFKSAPDFDDEKTRYQVEHIAGERGKGAEYTSPSCDTMRTYSNCVADCRVSHPLIYYKKCKSKS